MRLAITRLHREADGKARGDGAVTPVDSPRAVHYRTSGAFMSGTLEAQGFRATSVCYPTEPSHLAVGEASTLALPPPPKAEEKAYAPAVVRG